MKGPFDSFLGFAKIALIRPHYLRMIAASSLLALVGCGSGSTSGSNKIEMFTTKDKNVFDIRPGFGEHVPTTKTPRPITSREDLPARAEEFETDEPAVLVIVGNLPQAFFKEPNTGARVFV